MRPEYPSTWYFDDGEMTSRTFGPPTYVEPPQPSVGAGVHYYLVGDDD